MILLNNMKFFDCPQVYIILSGKVHERHLHYLYWDEKIIVPFLYTQPVITKKYFEKFFKALIIDALPEKMYNKKKHIKGAINSIIRQ